MYDALYCVVFKQHLALLYVWPRHYLSLDSELEESHMTFRFQEKKMPHDESFPDTRQQSRDSYPFPLNNTSAEEVEVESKKRGKSIFQNYEILGKILERHEESIQKRWLKKSRKQRLQILLSAWPDMPPTHRPFYDYWRQVETDATVKVKHCSSILWPFINKDSLGKPTPLLLLLNSRGRHPPPFLH